MAHRTRRCGGEYQHGAHQPLGGGAWACSTGQRDFATGGPLILYGPWLKDDIPTAPSNLAFDRDLRSRDPAWGLRRVEEFAAACGRAGFRLEQTRRMLANNLMLLLRP